MVVDQTGEYTTESKGQSTFHNTIKDGLNLSREGDKKGSSIEDLLEQELFNQTPSREVTVEIEEVGNQRNRGGGIKLNNIKPDIQALHEDQNSKVVMM